MERSSDNSCCGNRNPWTIDIECAQWQVCVLLLRYVQASKIFQASHLQIQLVITPFCERVINSLLSTPRTKFHSSGPHRSCHNVVCTRESRLLVRSGKGFISLGRVANDGGRWQATPHSVNSGPNSLDPQDSLAIEWQELSDQRIICNVQP